MLLAYLKRLFCKPANETEYISECDRVCRKMTGKRLDELPPWNFGIAYEDGIPPKYAVKEMLERNVSVSARQRREKAIETLARELQFKMEHLDPREGDWDDLSDNEQEFYRQSVKWLLLHRDTLLDAIN